MYYLLYLGYALSLAIGMFLLSYFMAPNLAMFVPFLAIMRTFSRNSLHLPSQSLHYI